MLALTCCFKKDYPKVQLNGAHTTYLLLSIEVKYSQRGKRSMFIIDQIALLYSRLITVSYEVLRFP